MFTRFEELHRRFIDYLCSESAQINYESMDSGFSSTETILSNVYGDLTNHIYVGKYSKEKSKIVLCEGSVNEQERVKNLDVHTFSTYFEKEFSYVDMLSIIGHGIRIDKNFYVLTDYGLISIVSYGKSSHIHKLDGIKVWLYDASKINEIEDLLTSSLVEIESKSKQTNLTICTNGPYGTRTTKLEIKPFNCDIKANYNDDLPYERLTEIINSDEQELVLLHGDPGTGKTSIIKKLIHDNPNVEFVYFDFNLLTSFSDAKVFDFLMDNKNNVLIIEDCEKLFTDRNNGNVFLNSMLNLTDGIIGEAFQIKFICTFNCPKNKIDQAVLREGRLSLIYEFKKLSLDKTRALIPSATEPMTLAKIYHTEDNGNASNERKIGF